MVEESYTLFLFFTTYNSYYTISGLIDTFLLIIDN